WLSAALRFSMHAARTAASPPQHQQQRQDDFTISNNGTTGPPQNRGPKDEFGLDPSVSKPLLDAVIFSRDFTPSYNAVVVAVLLFVALVHQYERFMNARRRWKGIMRELQETKVEYSSGTIANGDVSLADEDGGSSSSSSTLHGTATPPDLGKLKPIEDEASPLLGHGTSNPPPVRTHILRRLYWTIKSWLMYQPRPIPIVNKSLPSNGTSIFVFLFLSLNVFYTFYRVPLRLVYLFVFADRCGLLFTANLPLLYLLAAKNQPVKLLTGRSYESLNIFHRRLGELLCLLALLHGAGMVGVWYTLLRPFGFGLARFLRAPVILLGLLTLLTYETLYVTSLASFRRRWYEAFLGLHVGGQLAALVLLWFHHANARVWVGVALGIFVVDRLIFRLCLNTSTHVAHASVADDGATVLLSTAWDIPSRSHTSGGGLLARLRPRNTAHGWHPTAHVFVSIPSLGSTHAAQFHPFTIASAAPRPSPSDPFAPAPTPANLTLLVRAHAGFTSALLRHAVRRPETPLRVRLDGPYGTQAVLERLEGADAAVLVAGGSGVAVTFAAAWGLVRSRLRSPVEGGGRGTMEVVFVWIVRERAQLGWVPRERLDELREAGVRVVLAGPTGEVGRPDVEALVRGHCVGDGKEGASAARRKRVRVLVSGPDALNRDVRNACARLVRRGVDVGVDVEKFGW
ncbi:hypothetical protein BDY21DRAFT_259491, partial [Lineolata rhizophorae]